MPSPKSGSPGSIVAPAAPEKALDADVADPIGDPNAPKAAEAKRLKYEANPPKPYKPPKTPDEKKKKTSWIEIEVIDEADQPVTGLAYKITLADGKTAKTGTLDEKGQARVAGIEPGNCKVTFPTLDKEAWEKA